MVERDGIAGATNNADYFRKTLGDAEKSAGSFGDKLSGTGKKMSAFVSVPIAGFLAGATKAAAGRRDSVPRGACGGHSGPRKRDFWARNDDRNGEDLPVGRR